MQGHTLTLIARIWVYESYVCLQDSLMGEGGVWDLGGKDVSVEVTYSMVGTLLLDSQGRQPFIYTSNTSPSLHATCPNVG
jgi:hypothetical protein